MRDELTASREGYAPFRTSQTWFAIHGELSPNRLPVVVVHGGPGMTHDYLLDLKALSTEHPVVFYDQIGNGRSVPVGAEAAEFVSLAFQVAELENLLAHLNLSGAYVLLAHSAGGCVALEHALARPKGLRALILANTFPSGQLMQEGIRAWRDDLPTEFQHALSEEGSPDEMRAAAMGEFFKRHVCRVPPPEHLLRTLAASSSFPEVQLKMLGENLFHWTGELAGWSVTGRLAEIEVPTLALGGKWDEASSDCLCGISSAMTNCRMLTFEQSSHLPHIEEREAFLSAVRAFLAGL